MGMLLYMMEQQNKNKAMGATPKKEKEVAPKPIPADKGNEYTEEKIKKMNGTQLRKLAKKNGVEDPEELTVGELKSVLCGILVK